jgi:hypothetical protein
VFSFGWWLVNSSALEAEELIRGEAAIAAALADRVEYLLPREDWGPG